jgi:pyruvate dehydrogenase E1 component
MSVATEEAAEPTMGTHQDADPQETREWLDSLDAVIDARGRQRASDLLERLAERGRLRGVPFAFNANTPYVNTIPVAEQPPYPGDWAMERQVRSLIRWNAMAMVVRANKHFPGIGGHIASFASSATLYGIAFNQFLQGKTPEFAGDQVYFQGHAAPGIYARAFLEGRINVEQMENFRRELANGGGLSSYPHPWLMPDFWEFPTVSMGLAPVMSIYQARFNRYLHDRGLADTSRSRIWAFVGDGETDEPESLGAITLASRESLNNLIWVVNCNLQRLDGPVRGNGQIIQELEAIFRGAGWNVIKLLWGRDWDPLFAADKEGCLVRRLGEIVDGKLQKYIVESGDYMRRDLFGADPKLLKLVEHLTDDQLRNLNRGGHDQIKVYSAFAAAAACPDRPSVILAHTIKGYGLGEAGEGRNVSHQAKKLNEEELREFRDRFDIPISDRELAQAPFYHPGPNSPEVQYLMDCRRKLGGSLPHRQVRAKPLKAPPLDAFKELVSPSSKERAAATTMAFVRLLRILLGDRELGKLIVPIVPDEARTFGMEALFKDCGIYAHKGQLYEPVDRKMLLYYREAKDGQILEEGITEAGSMSSYIAAGTGYATHGLNTIPFFIYYSMFGFQRIGDLIWAGADNRAKGFLLGATAGRTTLMGEGLQHQDGHSHLLASTVPSVQPYDPAYAYEVAVIIQDGIRRMYEQGENIFYYLTLYNEKYEMPAMPEGAREGILKGICEVKSALHPRKNPHVRLFGSGPLLREALRAQELLDELYGVQADVWSVTSYTLLRREALEVERWNMLHPLETPRTPYVTSLLEDRAWPVIAVTDYMKAVADQISPWVPGGLTALGTDGFGRSDTREALRRFFEVDAECIATAALHRLAQRGDIEKTKVRDALKRWNIDPNKANPATA